jgi:hypothetical protein
MDKIPTSDLLPVPGVAEASPAEEKFWTAAEAIKLCRVLEQLAPAYGAHVALTGGCLYKDGPRKDVDIMFYRIRQVAIIDIDGLFEALEMIGIKMTQGFGFVYKAVTASGKNIDFFFPEEQGEYPH